MKHLGNCILLCTIEQLMVLIMKNMQKFILNNKLDDVQA